MDQTKFHLEIRVKFG